MTTTTILLIIGSLVVAGGLSYYQYLYKAKNKSNLYLFLAFLRFGTLFLIFLLLINPIITKNSLEIVKTPLAIVVDNSNSIPFLKADIATRELYKKITSNKKIQNKFELQSYLFDADFTNASAFNFKGKQSNFELIGSNLKNINRNIVYPAVLLSDGNQTSGNDYVYSFDGGTQIYPVILGDTTKSFDLKISQLNVNKYAFYKNKFPVEVFLQYSGNKTTSANFSISQGKNIISSQVVSFSPTKNTAVINLLLPASRTGLQVFKASIFSKEKERNTFNNSKDFAVQVIDQKTNVGIVSSINHPDIAALKRAIESNAQRKVTIVKPENISSLQDFNVLIFYQPNPTFKSAFEKAKIAGINSFTITGNNTDFNFLNQNQSNFTFQMSGQKEDYLAGFNSQFNLFTIDNIGFENFPPLQNPYGTVTTSGNVSVLLSSKIRNIATNAPLLAFTETQGKRSAILLGENCWKWRLQNHLENKSFAKFDLFIDKIIQFLASNTSRKSLVVEHESFYNSGEAIDITAQYFNKNYEFDENARLTIALTNSKTKQTKNYDLLKGSNAYAVNLDGLGAGSYDFTVKELNSRSSYSSHFEILEFDIEKQFVNPDIEKLNQLATETKGKTYYPNQVDALIQSLLDNEDYKSIQKNNTTKVPLIDWIWLLVLLSLFLTTEWFVRKYNGLL